VSATNINSCATQRPADQALYNDLLQFRFPPKSGQIDVNLMHEPVPLSYAQEKRWSVTGEMYPPNQVRIQICSCIE
jgi:hypothetical protein